MLKDNYSWRCTRLFTQLANRIQKVTRSRGVRRYAVNSGWMLLDHLIRALLGFLVGIYLARFMGPNLFGLYAYFLSMTTIFGTIARLGLDGVMVRELVKRPEVAARSMGTAFWIIVCAGLGSLTLMVVGVSLGGWDGRLVAYALMAGSVVVLQAFMVVDWYFQSRMQNRYAMACRTASLIICTILRVGAVYCQATLPIFFAICLIEQLVLAGIYMAVWWWNDLPPFPTCFDWQWGKLILSGSWPLVLAAIALSFHSKLDLIMIRIMLGNEQAGIYAAAIRIYEAWIGIPTLLSLSLLPAILNSKAVDESIFKSRMVHLVRFLFYLSVAFSIITFTISDRLILVAYGPAFSLAGIVLPVVLLGGPWSALGSCTMRYMIVENMERKIAFRCISGALISALLNILLIPRLGIQGPALAVLLSSFVTNYLLDWFDPDLRPLLQIKHRAILFIR